MLARKDRQMSENRYFVLHNAGTDPGWTMHIAGGRLPVTLEKAREVAEKIVRDSPTKAALIVEASYIVQTEFPPIRIRRYK